MNDEDKLKFYRKQLETVKAEYHKLDGMRNQLEKRLVDEFGVSPEQAKKQLPQLIKEKEVLQKRFDKKVSELDENYSELLADGKVPR